MGFTYCSSDEVLPGATDKELGDGAKMQLVVNMPTAVSTRSTTGADGKTGVDDEKGTENENKATSVGIAIYKEDGSFKSYIKQSLYEISGSTKYETPVFDANGSIVVGESYLVYLFINPSDSITYSTLNDAFNLSGDTFEKAIEAISTDGKFLMTTANVVEAGEVLPSARKVATPYKVVANVERAAARFDYKAKNTDNTYVVGENHSSAAKDVKVILTDYKLINTSKSFYNFKRVTDGTTTTLGGDEVADNYVVDTDWDTKKTEKGWSDLFFNPLSGEGFSKSKYTNLPTATDKDSKLTYVSENTIPKINQGKKGLATAIVFKGKLDLDDTAKAKYGITGTESVYVWNNTFYGVYDKLPNGVKAIIGGENSDKSKFVEAKVTRYTNVGGEYPVYYVYYNRHKDNGDVTKTGPMEFAVVRNNVYKLSITSIDKFGHPNDPEVKDPENPDPNPEDPKDPIETENVYMTVEATVLPWTVRTNNIEF